MPYSQERAQRIQALLNSDYFNENEYELFFNEDNVNDVLFEGWTPLTLAVECQNSLALQYFIDLGADLDKPGPEKRTAMVLAIFKNEGEMVDVLIKNHATIPLYVDGYPVLRVAIGHKMINLVHKLVEELGANVNEIDKEDYSTPLINAAEAGNLEIVKLLVREKAKVNYVPKSGVTAIAAAAIYNHMPIVKFLLHCKADVSLAKQSIKSRLEEVLKLEADDIEEDINYLRSGFERLIDAEQANVPNKLSRNKFEFFNARAQMNILREESGISSSSPLNDNKSGT